MSSVKYFNVRQTKANMLSSVTPSNVQFTCSKEKDEKNNLITKKWQTASVHYEKVYNLQIKTTKTFYRPVWFFGKQTKK